MTTSTTDAEAIARIIDPESWRVMDGYLAETKRKYRGQNVGWPSDQFQDKGSIAKANAILSYLASRREAQEPVDITWQDVRLHAGEGALSAADVLKAVNAHLRSLHRYTAPPAPAGETIEEFRQALGDARDEASDSLRTLDAIAEFVGCPHDEELTVDHVRQHYMKLENAAQRQGILDAGRIANAEARAAGAPAGEVERLVKPIIDRLEWNGRLQQWVVRPDLPAGTIKAVRAALNGGRE